MKRSRGGANYLDSPNPKSTDLEKQKIGDFKIVERLADGTAYTAHCMTCNRTTVLSFAALTSTKPLVCSQCHQVRTRPHQFVTPDPDAPRPCDRHHWESVLTNPKYRKRARRGGSSFYFADPKRDSATETIFDQTVAKLALSPDPTPKPSKLLAELNWSLDHESELRELIEQLPKTRQTLTKEFCNYE